MAKGEVWEKWMDENMFKVTIYVNKKNDEDLYNALVKVAEAGGSKSSAIKSWARSGLDKKAGR